MQIYNFFNWFTCCTPKTQECLHSKSIKSCINTEHYTEQIKEAFFAKLLHNKGINLCFCQESTSPDLIQSQNFYFMNGLSKYPFKKDQIFLLKYTTKACVIASLKIINFLTRNLKKNPTAFKSHSDKLPEQKIEDDEKLIQSTKVSIMSLKKISRSKQEFSKLVKGMPEEMVEHLVQRFNNGDLIIDLLNGIHSLSLNLALKGVFVMAIEQSSRYLTVFKHSAGIWDFTDQIMAIQGNFLEMKLDNLRPDAIIINFKAETIDLLKEKFCLFKHITPNIREILKKASLIANKIVLILPKNVELDEIALLFKDYFDGCREINQKPIGNSIEIECLSINNKIEKIIVYFGSISSITYKQELSFMVSNLSEDRDPNSASLSDYSQLQISSFLKKLSNRLNINQLTSCLLNIDDSNPHITQFQAFIEQIKNRFSISNEEILEYLQSNKVERIIDVINNDADNNIGQKEEYSDDGSVHSWGNSSTPAFNDFVGLREIKRKLGSEECKSAQLIPNKNQDCYSFQKNI